MHQHTNKYTTFVCAWFRPCQLSKYKVRWNNKISESSYPAVFKCVDLVEI